MAQSMSAKENACRKFQANIFNKSKCQNCFKAREAHLLTDEDVTQAKPIYGGWLLLAPEGTNFDNPLHRSRKWQRRFFLLYEHGLLRYALDDMATTLPQGTINLNQCVDVVDGESRTGQKHSLCICTPDQDHYLRAESKEVIHGWQEALMVFPRTNKQNQKKKRKVETPTPQEPGPAKVTVTSASGSNSSMVCLPSTIAQAERVPPTQASLWQEESWSRAAVPTTCPSSNLSQHSEESRSSSVGRKPRVESGYFSLEKNKPEQDEGRPHQRQREPESELPQQLPTLFSTSFSSSRSRRSQVIERFECNDAVDTPEQMDTTSSLTESALSYSRTANQRAGRNERRLSNQKQEFSLDSSKGRTDAVSSLTGYRRAKSLDRRATETLMAPDLLNFKKGWMTKLYEDGLWKKHWFVLTDQSLRYYRDSIAEEASDLDGEIDLSTCYDVTEFPVQRNYGFQILSKDGACTMSAMTSGIRRNWIQAILKNMRPTVAPDVTRKNVSLKLSVLMPSSLPEERSRSNVEQNFIQPSPNSSQLSNSSAVEAQRSHHDITDVAPSPEQHKSRVSKREGRSKTFDWAEFRPGQENENARPPRKRADTSVVISTSSPSSSDSSPISSSSSPLTSSSITNTSHTDELPQRDEEELVRDSMCQEHHHQTTLASSVSEPPSKHPHKMPQEQARIDVDQTRDTQEVDGHRVARRNSDVQVEIEQRWYQVETTPLREEKQVPITGSSAPNTSNAPVEERLLPQEPTTILEKELGQAQKELARLQQQNSVLQEQLQDARGREQNAREGYILQATCERGFAAMEETHQKVIEDIQRQHQREIRKLLEEKERLLEEETNATIAAIEAMKNAHREELGKTQRTQMSGVSADIQELRRQYEEELQSIYRELEVLSEQYSQKCLENAHLAQALEAERQALGQCQRENHKLHTHNQDLNHRLNEEITRMHSCGSGNKATSSLTQGKDIYELEVLLRVKESEIQYLKQEINSLKDELQSALRDKKYTSDKYKDIYTELSIVKAKADCDIKKLREKLLAATDALGELDTGGGAVTTGYDIMKSKSNPDFLKKERSRQLREVRSKSLKEGLTVQERMKLFETKDSRKT
ncbi:myosin phosphatase Rho-interacting protein-like isoform X4 [Xyrauchen texanus]|uniref:myosin phosphatase Rho-interacting protein-like isoform X4 n=1 Tax=Xyrauchen texanus TaxID=154827 RepID=UPI0022421B8F|nr:myosin phosphatase Rho-interacting protein-like isoform X4 [Xyrauchen texanus]